MPSIQLDVSKKDSKKKKKKKEKSLLEEFDEMEALEQRPTMTIADYRPKTHNNGTDYLDEDGEDMTTEWVKTIAHMHEPMKIKGSRGSEIFGDYISTKKKGKKKKKGKDSGPKDYSSDFEPEMALIKNLLHDQTNFTQSLQRRYDIMDNSKSSARGVGKFTTDLITQINQARSVSLNLVDKMAGLKKTIADLNMKERKENAAAGGEGGLDLANFGATYLKKMIEQDRDAAYLYGDDSPVEGGEQDIYDAIRSHLGEDERDPEIDLMLQYENRGVQLIASVNQQDYNDWSIVAIASDNGEVLTDYPLPEVTSLEVNASTGYASDQMHTKYQIEWR